MNISRYLTLLGLLFVFFSADAEVIVGGSYDDDLDFFSTPGFRLTNGAAVGFRPTETVFLDRVDLYFRYSVTPTMDTFVELRSRFDIFELLPGDLLETVLDPCTDCTSEAQVRSFEFSGTTRLEAGELYWIAVGTGVRDQGTAFEWAIPFPLVAGPLAIRTTNDLFFLAPNGSPDGIEFQPAFQVIGTVVPIPAAIWSFASGLLLLLARLRAKRSTR